MSGVKRTEFTSEMCVNFDLKMDFIQSLVTPEDYENDSLPVRLYKHRMISRVGKVEVFLQKDFCFFTIGEVRMLFERNNWANYDSFSSVKVLLSKYVMYCKARGLISPESVHPIENIVFEDISHDISSYQYDFKNFDEFYDYLEEIYSTHNTNAIDDSRYLCSKVIFYLFYLGFQYKEIELIKEDDIGEDSISVFQDGVLSYRVEDVDRRIIAACRDLKALESFDVERNSDGEIKSLTLPVHSYQHSLIRFHTKSSGDHIWSYSTLSRITYQANNLSENLPLHSRFYRKRIASKKIWYNGIYEKIYAKEKELQRPLNYINKNDAEILCRLSRKPVGYRRLKKIYDAYLEWKDFFYN